uniref:Uncharacterized protein n=2 Tax=Opuntia streptacantha TaxID=393608 RepID=A0A7C9ASR6_OPUST
MAGHIVIRSSPVDLTRRQPLIAGTLTPPGTPLPPPPRTMHKSSSNVGEVAGGTAAGCFVVCCCCPCVLVEFVLLAVYKVPATICRRILRKRRRKMIKKKKGLLQQAAEISPNGRGGFHHPSYSDELSDVDFREFETVKVSIDGSAEAVELDKQMWDQFNSTGFWRSPSQRHT